MKKKFLILVLCWSIQCLGYSEEKILHILSIDSMFKIADDKNRSIQLQKLLEQSAQEGVAVTKNTLLPTIDLSLSASYLGNVWIADRNFSNGQNEEMPHFGNNLSIEASQVIFSGGAIRNKIKNAKLAHQKSIVQREKCQQDIRFALINEYLQIFHFENQEEIYEKNIAQTKKLVSDVQVKAQEGLALKNDITRYELQLQNLELALTQAQNNKIIAQNRLRILLGLPKDSEFNIDKEIINNLPIIRDEAEWLKSASSKSPDIKLSQIAIKESENNLRLIRSKKIPSLVAFAGDKLDGPITIEVPPINKNLNYWYVGIGLKYSISSLYKATREEKQSEFYHSVAKESEKVALDEIEIKINESWVRFHESFSILATKEKSYELAKNNYEIVNNRYLNDLALITDMLDASNSQLSAELQMADSKINILIHYFNLCRISGTL